MLKGKSDGKTNHQMQKEHFHLSKPQPRRLSSPQCDRLAEARITFVAVHFGGPGDEGVNEDLKCYTEDYAYQQSEVQEANFSYLQENFEALIPNGYEIGCGGFGDVILNVNARKITGERNDRYEDYTTTSYEV